MIRIHNSALLNEIREATKMQIGTESVPNFLSNQVVPVININPNHLRKGTIVRSINATNSTSATIYTTPDDADFYLTGFCVSVIKDATATSTYSRITTTKDGKTIYFGEIATLTLTPQHDTIALNLSTPVKIDRGVNINATNSTATGNVTCRCGIIGYLDEQSNA